MKSNLKLKLQLSSNDSWKNFVEIETDLISGTELSLFDCGCYASQTKQLSVQGATSTRWYDSLCHRHGFEQNQQSPVMWSETIGLTTRPV